VAKTLGHRGLTMISVCLKWNISLHVDGDVTGLVWFLQITPLWGLVKESTSRIFCWNLFNKDFPFFFIQCPKVMGCISRTIFIYMLYMFLSLNWGFWSWTF